MSVFRSPAHGGKRPNPDAEGSAARAGDGQGRQKQDRVTDAEGERSVLARGLRRPKADPARSAREHGARYPVVVSQSHSAEKDLAPPEGCHLLAARPGNARSMERGDLMGAKSGLPGRACGLPRPACERAPGRSGWTSPSGQARDPSGGSISRFLAAALVLLVV